VPRKPKPAGRKKRTLDEFDFDFDSDEDYAGSPGARPARRASKRSRADIKELKDLGIGDADLEEWDPEEPLVPRTWGLRSKHAAEKAAAPSSTGLGLSAGPAPSDARTGAGGGAEAADTAGTDQLWGGLGESGAAEGRRRMPAVPAMSTGPPKREDFERLLVRCQKKDIHSMFKDPVTEAIVSACAACYLCLLGCACCVWPLLLGWTGRQRGCACCKQGPRTARCHACMHVCAHAPCTCVRMRL
jgi:hypothetical protein